jgi:hypothetical protein
MQNRKSFLPPRQIVKYCNSTIKALKTGYSPNWIKSQMTICDAIMKELKYPCIEKII